MSERKLPDDRELEEFLAGRSDVSRRYREGSPAQGAPPELDRVILDLAAQAIEREQRARKRAFVVPLSLAASVAVIFTLVLLLRQQTGGLPPPALDGGSEPPPAAVPASPLGDAAADRLHTQALESSPPQVAAPELAPAPMAATAAAPAAPEQDSAREPKAEREALQRQERRRDAARATMDAAAAKSADRSTQAAWLERIRALKAQGDIDDAREQLDAFQKAHPDAEIPDDLRSLLRPVTPPTP